MFRKHGLLFQEKNRGEGNAAGSLRFSQTCVLMLSCFDPAGL